MFRTLYRTVVVLSALIVVFFCAYKALVKPPEQAAPPTVEVPQPTDVTDDPNTEEDESALPTPTPLVRKEGFYTFLLAATDEGGGNTDTIMVVGYDTANQEMGVVSIPRDTLVDRKIPKINSVYASDGIDGLKDVVSDLIGIPIDHYVTVNLNGFQRLVNAVGGVDFYVPCDMNYDDPTQNLHIHLNAGLQDIDGDKAMQLLRWRKNSDAYGNVYGGYPNGDLGRIETQQAFLKEVVRKCLQPDVLLSNLMDYISIFQKNVTTDLSVGNLAYFGKSAIGRLDMDSVEFVTLPNQSAGDAHLLPVGSQIVEMVNEGFNPYQSDISLRDLNLAGKRPGSSSTGTTPRPQATPKPETTPSATSAPVESPPGTPPATSTPGGSQPPAISTPGGQTPPPVQTPAATPAPAVPSAEPAPGGEHPSHDAAPGRHAGRRLRTRHGAGGIKEDRNG